MKTAIILLAAGASRRLGQPKQLVVFEGKTLLRRATEAALAISKTVVVVVGSNAEWMKNELAGLEITFLENENWEEGMAASVRIGADWAIRVVGEDANNGLEKPKINAVLFSVIDQPKLEATVFQNLLFEFEKSEKGIAASLFDDQTIGPPVVFRPRFLPELLELSGDAGAKKVVLRHEKDVLKVPFSGGEWDVDEAKDLARL